MAARDDSVIRGSLITSLILLVLSLVFNFILWSWGSGTALTEANKSQALDDANTQIRNLTTQNINFGKMLGAEPMSDDEYEGLASSTSGDAKFDALATAFYNDMKVFDASVGRESQNYGALAPYFMDLVRARNSQYTVANAKSEEIRIQADGDIAAARAAQQKAEEERDNFAKQLDEERSTFTVYRDDMLVKMESAKDSKSRSERAMQELERKSGLEKKQLLRKTDTLALTIDNQKKELNRLRGGQFETTQGEIRYVLRGGNLVSINLGSADELRRGITFGVFDRDETTRLQEANVKASIQVTKILGPHFAEARVVRTPEIGTPIIEGDTVYSPFWAPGRTVRIALAGDIDIDGDGRPDNDELIGMILAAGAKVEDKLDPGVRFLVIGEQPELGGANEDNNAELLAAIGAQKEEASQMGVTVIPAWKLQSFLKTLDDSLTTPLGSAARAEDFPPESTINRAVRRPTNLPEIFKKQLENVQRTNEIARP